ncbi:PadR family transcriptional regulator [Clostridium sp. MSJ-11]|uniref:PadR family transcriptional regulator n=1 Tax=Clostridium mobile TaxID=2841512 RepID=A0ABS6EF14_9CLOT|nr:PadR family transcriptional regulator [Clostridium mobile]MBU5483605.1 PadR family transcriptional regulator [Clostridium mobile]
MDKEILKGSIDILILLLVQKQDTYGYEIAKNIKEKSNGLYIMGEGTLYPALKRLEEKELIQSYWQNYTPSNKRKYYKITPKGKETLMTKLLEWDKITSLIKIFKEV